MQRLQQALGYAFRDPSHLRLALTHPSTKLPDNQRLEFLGDAVKEAERTLAELTEKREAGEQRQEELQRGLSRAHESLLAQNEALHQAREALTAVENRLKSGEEALERLSGEEGSLRARLRLIEATMTQSDGGLSEAEKLLSQAREALDDANISYFADYLKEFSKDTQFIVVTHRKGTMERCDTLFGVAMEERGVSSMVSVNLTEYE